MPGEKTVVVHCNEQSGIILFFARIFFMEKQVSPSGSAEQELEAQALSKFNAGKYKDAIGLYKKLLRGTDNESWRKQLAHCYLLRALGFAAKGMYKEAVVLWENYQELVQPPYKAYDHYLAWLLNTGQFPRFRKCLQQLTAKQIDRDYRELVGWLGLLIISGHPEFQQDLPGDSAFAAHLQTVQAALQAHGNNDPEAVQAVLQQLPHRSAFRDFRTLLKAALLATEAPQQARSLLDRIAPASPYAQAARLLYACTCSGAALAQEMTRFTPKQRRMIGAIKGLNKKQSELLEQLAKFRERLNDKAMFNLAIRHQALFGEELAQDFCRSLLRTYPAGRRDFKKHFAGLDEFEENRMQALACERNDQIADAVRHWELCVRALREEPDAGGLRSALILRHIAHFQLFPDNVLSLQRSLDYDPDDRDCYLQILREYESDPDSAEDYKTWLNKALQKFPDDIDVLTLGLQSAVRHKTYKKAAQYAKKILQRDPLHTLAKELLFSSHLDHARRQLLGRKYHLVAREIDQADELHPGKSQHLQAQLLRGCLSFATGDKKAGLQLITESLDRLHEDPVNAAFHAVMEALATGLPVATILRELPPVKGHLLSAQELRRLIVQIERYAEVDGAQKNIHKALDKVKAVVKKSLQQDFPEDLLLSWCQTMDRIRHFELLRHVAKLAQKRWQKPIWTYYRIYSETNGDPEKCSYQDVVALEYMQQQAVRAGDQRAMALIGDYLERCHVLRPQSATGFFDDLFGFDEDDEEVDEPMEVLFGHLPDDVLQRIEDKMASMLKKVTPEKLVQEMVDVVGGKKNVLMAIMQEPELFSVLMLLNAANKLGIDTGVSVDEVLRYFDIDSGSPSRAFPFPF